MRVVDLSRLFPGPYCSSILADLGAEVIKIESPAGGDWVRHVPPLAENGEGLLFRALNRGKKSMTLNLRSPEGRGILHRLAATADVFLESFRPGAMDRLGLGYDALCRTNPCLVYCSLSGYGSLGPYRRRAGHDLNYVGLAGVLDLTGPRDGPPAIPGAPMADVAGALWATIGILQALLERDKTGRGQRVEASLLGGALSLLPIAVAERTGGQEVARGATVLTGAAVCYNVYECAGGEYVTLAALEPEFWAAFCRAVGREELIEMQFAPAQAGELAYEALRTLFLSRSRAEWAEALAGVDACCEPVYGVGEALASAPVRALGMTTAEGLLPPLRLSASPRPPRQPAPSLGQHTAQVLAELGYGAAQVERLRAEGVV